MFASRARIIIITFLVLPAGLADGAQLPEPKADGQKPKTDLYGDPLPTGAIARCGTMRLRHPYTRDSADAAFAPDGKSIATKDGETLRLWDAMTGKLIWELPERQAPMKLLFSPDGKLIEMLGKNVSTCLVESKTGKLLLRIPKGNEALAFSPDSKLLATHNAAGEVFFWNTTSGEKTLALKGRAHALWGGAFTPNGTTFVTVSSTGSACRWDVATGNLVGSVELALPEKHDACLSPDGRLLAVMPSDSDNGPVAVWDTKTGKQQCTLDKDEGKERRVRFFTKDGRILVTSKFSPNYQDSIVSFWDTESGKLRRHLTLPNQYEIAHALSENEKTLLTHSDGIVHLWDAVSGKPRIQYPTHEKTVWSLAYKRDGKRLVSGAWDGDIRVWDAATGKPLQAIKSHKWGVRGLVLSRDEKTVLSGGYDGTVRLHELATGREQWRFDIGSPPELQKLIENQVLQVRFTADGKSAVSFTYVGNADGMIHQLDAATGKEVFRRSLPYTDFRNGSFSADGKLIHGIRAKIIGPGENPSDPKIREQERDTAFVLLQDAATGREVFSARLPDFSGPYHRLTPDGRMIVTETRQLSAENEYRITKKTTLRLFELASGKERLAIDLPPGIDGFHILRPLAVSDDCQTLAAARSDGILQLWDLASGKELLRRKGYASQAQALAFTPDGKRLASGHLDGTILIWDLSPEIDHRPSPTKADAKQVEQWWTALAGDDAKQAHAAIWGLVGAPERTLPLLRDHLHPAEAPPGEKLKQLLGDLDSDEFAKRNTANKELAEFEELAEPAMRDALREDISEEKRRRLEKLLDITLIVRTPEKLRQLRALEVLEQIGTPEARQLLVKLSKGVAEARLTRDAKAALQRLERR
jgi:WD40 repeat protein